MGEQTIEYIAQGIGIVGMVISILSFQCKRNRDLCIAQAISGGMFAINFALLGALSGGAMNFINVFRGFLFAFIPEKHRMKVSVGLIAAYAAATVVTFGTPFFWNGVFSILVCLAQTVGTIFMHINDGQKLRIAQLAFVSPVWLSHNIYFFSIGGIICECFSITSVIVSMIRYRGGKFEK